MTELKHTPGPWQIKSEYEPLTIIGNVDGPDDGQYHYTPICEVEETLFHDENAANARLIAAAPELLAALECISEMLDTADDTPLGQIGRLLDDMANRCTAALAKAREA